MVRGNPAHLSSVWYWTPVEGEDTAFSLKSDSSLFHIKLSLMGRHGSQQVDGVKEKSSGTSSLIFPADD